VVRGLRKWYGVFRGGGEAGERQGEIGGGGDP